MRMHNPAHPGLVLKEFMGNLTVTEMAENLGITRTTLSRILNGRQGISAEMSIRLSCALGNQPDFWLRLQNQYDLWQAENRTDIDYSRITRLIPSNLANTTTAMATA